MHHQYLPKRYSLSVGLAALVALGWMAAASAAPKPEKHFVATLTGAAENPSRLTPATGTVKLKIDPHDRYLDIQVHVADITNTVAAHIHIGDRVTNGPVVVDLFLGPRIPGPFEGELADLRIFPTDVKPGFTWEQVLAAIRSDLAYVNVHTNDGVAPTNTGPGDFPGGEIRGHLVPK